MPSLILAARPRHDREASMRARFGGRADRVQSWDIDTYGSGPGARGAFSVILARERITMTDARWHISVAGKERVPSWELMVEIAHRFRPGVMFCVPMPPRQFWLNLHEHCMHLWQINDPNLEAQWRGERRAAERLGVGQSRPT